MASIKHHTHRMGLTALIIMSASNMMGSGVFMLPASLAQIGSISVFGCLIAAIGILFIALCFSKITALLPGKGGAIGNIDLAFGPYIGLQTSLFYWLSSWIGNCALLITGVGYLAYFFPILHTPIYAALAAIAILWAFVLLGLQGAKIVGYAQIFTGLCMLTVILSVGIFGWSHFDKDRYLSIYNVSTQTDFRAMISAALLSIWGFLGIESASVSTGQVKNPKRNIPLATIIGLAIVTLCYLSSSSAIMGILPYDKLITSSSPFADTAQYMWGYHAGEIISALAIIACLGAMPGWQILQTEVPRAAAEKGLFPAFFADTNRNGVPYKGLICTALLMSFVLFLTVSPDLEKQFRTLILLAISASLFSYTFALMSLPVTMVMQKHPKNRTFYLYLCLSLIGFSFAVIALLNAGMTPIFWGMALQIFTIPLFLLCVNRQRKKVESA